MAVRVYLVEDHLLYRDSLAIYLEVTCNFEVCGMAGTAEVALEEIPELDPSIVLVDLSLPGPDGLSVLEGIRSRTPVPCIVLSGHGERSHVERALASGAKGYVLKGRPEEVRVAMERVLAGGRYISEPLREGLALDPTAEE